jgi:hypothetical protein
VILDPVNDVDCLGQLTVFARELAPSTLVRGVAEHLKTREAVIQWLQGLRQADDFGDEHVRFIQCDVPQRVRLFPDDPNCVERSFGALMLLDVLEPQTPRALATVDKPLRHTGLVEKSGEHWRAVDLFPRRNSGRNFSWDSFGKDVLHGVHNYVGKPVLKFYLGDTGGKVADALAEQEGKLIGDKTKQEKKPTPPAASAAQRPSDGAKPPTAQPVAAATSRLDFASLIGAGANQTHAAPAGAGDQNGQTERSPRGAGATAFDVSAVRSQCSPQGATHGGDRDSHDSKELAQRFWRDLGR